MGVYRIAELNIAYTPQTSFAASFLHAYETEQDAQLECVISPSMVEAEAAFLPDATRGIREITAILRELGRVMPLYDRLSIHAATVVLDGNAYAFIAPSGTGKTTHAQIWERHYPDRARILNGDKLFVHLHKDGATAYGNPWRGTEHLGYDGCAPLCGIVILSRSDIACCEPLTPADALPFLLRATPCPQARDDRLRVLTLLETLTTRISLYHLHAPASVDAVKAVLSAIGGTL